MTHLDREKPARGLEPVTLLFASGFGIGLVFPLSKLATIAGVPPLTYMGLSALGASVVLWLIARLLRTSVRLTGETIRYAVIAGGLTYAIPFGTLAFVVAHIGSGIPAILQSLTAMITFALIAVLRMQRLGLLHLGGLGLGLAGTLIILLSRHQIELGEGEFAWLAVALVTPFALAFGNVYRSRAWPPGERPVALAAMTFAAVAILMLGLETVIRWMAGGWESIGNNSGAWRIIAAQSLASGLGYYFFFRLQQVGGPVYLSQISYVNTAVGLVFAVFLLGETISGSTSAAVLLIFAGIAMVNTATLRERGRAAVKE